MAAAVYLKKGITVLIITCMGTRSSAWIDYIHSPGSMSCLQVCISQERNQNYYIILQEQIKLPLTMFCRGWYSAVLFQNQSVSWWLIKKKNQPHNKTKTKTHQTPPTLSQCVPLMKRLRKTKKPKKLQTQENQRPAFLWNSWNPPVLFVMKVGN